MNLRQTIQAASARAKDAMLKLERTSSHGPKTRESLLQDLVRELTIFLDIEKQHLLPLLHDDPESNSLAAETLKGNEDLRAGLAELVVAPQDSAAFLTKLAELNGAFQRHARDDRKELLPAVLKALNGEEARGLVERIENDVADAESAVRNETPENADKLRAEADEAQRAAAEAEAAERERQSVEDEQCGLAELQAKAEVEAVERERQIVEREQSRGAELQAKAAVEAAEAAERERQSIEREKARVAALQAEAEADSAARVETAARASVLAEQAAKHSVRQVVEGVQSSGVAAHEGARRVMATFVERTEKALSATGEAWAAYDGSLRETAEGMRAVSASSSIGASAASDVGSAWFEWFGAAARTNAEATQRLMQCRTFKELAEVQGDFLTGAMRNCMERNARVLEVSQRSAEQARSPLDARLTEAAA